MSIHVPILLLRILRTASLVVGTLLALLPWMPAQAVVAASNGGAPASAWMTEFVLHDGVRTTLWLAAGILFAGCLLQAMLEGRTSMPDDVPATR